MVCWKVGFFYQAVFYKALRWGTERRYLQREHDPEHFERHARGSVAAVWDFFFAGHGRSAELELPVIEF